MTKQIELKVTDLGDAISYLGNRISSADDIHSYRKSPIHALVHNEILKYSKKELESYVHDITEYSLYDEALSIHNPLILSALIKQGAFVDCLAKESKWILKRNKEVTDELFQFIYYIEDSRVHDHNTKDTFFYCLFESSESRKNPNHKLLDEYYEDFWKKDLNKILNFIVRKYKNNSHICEYLLTKLKNDKIDLNQGNLLNSYLPVSNRDNSTFFISTADTPSIKKLLEHGFRFNENYTHNGDNLFISVINSRRIEIIETIVPYLTINSIKPAEGITIEQQHKHIDSLKQEYPNTFQYIKTNYYRILLEGNLILDNQKKDKKLKV